MDETNPSVVEPVQTDVQAADIAADEAAQKATEARETAERVREASAVAAQSRADAVEASKPIWQTIHETAVDRTERLILEGGYMLRSTWRHLRAGMVGGDPLTGSSLTFVPGAAPAMVNAGVMVLSVADLVPGVDPYMATIADVHPIRQLAAAPEVILFLPDGLVRVLKSRTAEMVGVTRAATPADGPAPKVAPTPAEAKAAADAETARRGQVQRQAQQAEAQRAAAEAQRVRADELRNAPPAQV
jgi:hypothetical protein